MTENTAITKLHFNQNEIRTVLHHGEMWWVAKDVGEVLGLSHIREALRKLDGDEKASVRIPDTSSNGTTQHREVNIVNEPGLYGLIFQSRTREAKAFTRWVRHEVLPQISRRGFYVQAMALPEAKAVQVQAFKLEAAKKTLEAAELELKAKAVFDVEGAVPVAGWLRANGCKLRGAAFASECGVLKRQAEQMGRPVGRRYYKGQEFVVTVIADDLGDAYQRLLINREARELA